MGHAYALPARARRVLVALVATIVVTAGLVAGTAVPSRAAGPPPNTSIFFYAASLGGVTGTLSHGQFKQTANVSVPGFTAAALTRDTLLLYDENTGQAAIATLKAGHLSPFKTVTGLGKYFALAAGSCDSIVLYKSVSGAALVLAVSGGNITHRKSYQLPKAFQYVDASCDTVSFYKAPPTGSMVGSIMLGTLKKGVYAHTANLTYVSKYASQGLVIAHSTHSYLRYDPFAQTGQWGTSSGGQEKTVGAANFSFFEYVAGTADSVILYEWQSGTAAFATLSGGVYSFVGSTTLSAGWQFIVGGK
jgi:hypothetical protein